MTRALLVLLSVSLSLSRVAAADGRQVAYAIVIGNNAPPRTGTSEVLRPLRYADDDAVRYFQLFSRFAQAHLLTVLDTETQRRYPGLAARTQPPTLENLEAAVDEIAAEMRADRARGDRPILYFAFSGHGARDDQGHAFLALLDGAITQHVLYDQLIAKMPATLVHVIVDACDAGGVVGVRGGFFGHEANTTSAPTTPAEVAPILAATPLARYPQVGVIVATTLGQEAHEWSAIESGVFTHELLSALVGAADVNRDGVIEYTEVEAFIAAANRDLEDPRAIPHVIARPPRTNQRAPLVRLSALRGTRLVHGDASRLGHFHIELANGQRYLDAHLDGEVTLAVPDDTTAFLRTDTQEVRLPTRGAVALDALALSGRRLASRGAIEAAYQAQLFSTRYGRAYYQGYVDSIGAIGVTFPEPSRVAPAAASRRRELALGAAGIAALSAAAAITTGVLAYRAHADFDATSLQRPAHEAAARYHTFLPLSIASGAVALAAGALTWWLWPRSRVHLAAGATSISMELTW